MTLYMKVSDDELELPEAVCDSWKELAKACGKSLNAMHSLNYKRKTRGQRCLFIKVEEGDDVQQEEM